MNQGETQLKTTKLGIFIILGDLKTIISKIMYHLIRENYVRNDN